MATTELTYSPEPAFRQYLHQLDADFDSMGEAIPISADTITDYKTTLGRYDVAFDLAKDPKTNSVANTYLKNEERKTMTNSLRSIVRQVTAVASPKLLTQLAMPVRSRHVQPVPVPTGSPTVTAEAVGPTTLKATARDSGDATSRRKPAGVRTIAYVTFAGENPPTDVRMWGQATLSGRTTTTLQVPSVREPSTVWVSAWFISSRNEAGPASQPIKVRVLGAGSPVPNQQAEPTPMKIAA